MTEKGFRIKGGINKQQWEGGEFPIVCDSCLGENQYVRMMKTDFDRECKICKRPFTVFRWKPGQRARYKKTEICQTCARLKNVCQTCIFDLQFGLPVSVRDQLLDECEKLKIPKEQVNLDYWAVQQHEKGDDIKSPYQDPEVQAKMKVIAEKYLKERAKYDKNLANVCSFWE